MFSCPFLRKLWFGVADIMRQPWFNGITRAERCKTRSVIYRRAMAVSLDRFMEITERRGDVVALVQLLDKYVGQSCEPEAGKQEHNHAEHRVRIFSGAARSPVCFVWLGGTEGFSML